MIAPSNFSVSAILALFRPQPFDDGPAHQQEHQREWQADGHDQRIDDVTFPVPEALAAFVCSQ